MQPVCRRKARCGVATGLLGLLSQVVASRCGHWGLGMAVSAEVRGMVYTASPEAHSARELGQEEPRPSGLLLDTVPRPKPPAWESPQEGLAARPSSWPEPRRSHGSPGHRRHNLGVWEVRVGPASGLGRHVDVPEREGATGGLVPKQQGWRV